MNKIKEIQRINDEELKRGTIGGGPGSWHSQYKDSSYVFAGGLAYELTEGDLLCVFSQWGEIEDINLVRDEGTGKSKGFCFVKYEDQRSSVLAVDNFNGTSLCGRQIHVDHVLRYKLPKHLQDKEDEADAAKADGGHYGPEGGEEEGGSKYVAGHAYKGKELASRYDISHGVDLYDRQPEEGGKDSDDGGLASGDSGDDDHHGGEQGKRAKKEKKSKKEKKAKKEKKKEEKKHKKDKKRGFDELSSAGFDTSLESSSWGSTALPPAPPPPAMTMLASSGDAGGGGGGDDSWRGRMASSSSGESGQRGGGKGGGGHMSGQHVGGFGSSGGKGAKMMGPKFGGGGGGGGCKGGKGEFIGGKGGKGYLKGNFDGGTYGGMNRLR
jgi:RNA-binding motif X-linked protein 2